MECSSTRLLYFRTSDARHREIPRKLAGQTVTGKVIVKLKPYNFRVWLVLSLIMTLMRSEFGEYGEKNSAWTADDVKGFTKVLSTSLKIHNSVNKTF